MNKVKILFIFMISLCFILKTEAQMLDTLSTIMIQGQMDSNSTRQIGNMNQSANMNIFMNTLQLKLAEILTGGSGLYQNLPEDIVSVGQNTAVFRKSNDPLFFEVVLPSFNRFQCQTFLSRQWDGLKKVQILENGNTQSYDALYVSGLVSQICPNRSTITLLFQ